MFPSHSILLSLTEEHSNIIRDVEDPLQHALVHLLNLVGDLQGVIRCHPPQYSFLIADITWNLG